MKYQFCVNFVAVDRNSSANKAVEDCSRILTAAGYADHTIAVHDNADRRSYYLLLLKRMIRFFFSIRDGSLVAVQYPLLSVNRVFRYFILAAKLKAVRFFCVIHDLESLRTGGADREGIKREIRNLNYFDALIVHNEEMRSWLSRHGVKRPMVLLGMFDYLSADAPREHAAGGPVVFAGNLMKSSFTHRLDKIRHWRFRLYGPGYLPHATDNVSYAGEFSPAEVMKRLDGSFGLIWDGISVESADAILGNYLKFNNPHKFSLYIAAGLPVIAPRDAAIARLIRTLDIGILVDSPVELNTISVGPARYSEMSGNVKRLREKVVSGYFFSTAIAEAERMASYGK